MQGVASEQRAGKKATEERPKRVAQEGKAQKALGRKSKENN